MSKRFCRPGPISTKWGGARGSGNLRAGPEKIHGGDVTRVVVVGARCRRQGIGEYVGRYFAEAGAELCAVVGTSDRTVDEARRALRERCGVACRGYTSLDDALEREQPGIVAICSPYCFHREQLEIAARAGVHCLCEKPFWWEEEAADRGAETTRLVDLFVEAELYLALVTQWPYTLPAFYRLHPQAAGQTVDTFRMRLSPLSSGVEMVIDAAPHVLSMLQRLVGRGRIRAPRAEYRGAERADLRLIFDYHHAAGTTAVSCVFRRCEERPRPASYAINDTEAWRRVDLPSYNMFFEAEGRKTRLEDPLGLLVQDFLAKVHAAAPTAREELIESITCLETLEQAAAQA